MFSEGKNLNTISVQQKEALQALDSDCRLLLYPEQLNLPDYSTVKNPPEPLKRRILSKIEKEGIRCRVRAGDSDVYKLSTEFKCSWQQIAGLKAQMQL